jgi:hypothetical protein
MHAGGAVMQSDAGISSALVGILQALILFSIAANFLAAIWRRLPGTRSTPHAPPPVTPASALMTEAAATPPSSA